MSSLPLVAAARPPAPRFVAIDALKALAAQVILLHHALIYGPLAAALDGGMLIDALQDYGRYAVQIFLVLGGYLAAQGLERARSRRTPLLNQLLRRHLRLALPFMVAVALTLLLHALTAPWIPELLPQAIEAEQLLAHALLLHGVLDQEALTVGAWYVAIDFQLFALLALLSRQRLAGGWLLALTLASAYAFNRWSAGDNWAPYFFAAYGLGVWVQRLQALPRRWVGLGLLSLALIGALALDFRGRLALALLTAWALVAAQWRSQPLAWPDRLQAWIQRRGQASYALFLVHFPVLLAANALFVLGGGGTLLAFTLLLGAWCASQWAAAHFLRQVELPTLALDLRPLLARLGALTLLPMGVAVLLPGN
ncbi:peptidoglycan/LPS O-acetylase OafA/YrhL [Inhella inkyongensis]|uniref:Peptidoglycan/LPS O-acetylase OafA/YrhL n=1 Tax=Inhella inkyongensis TaxID=392593 RepID=A0A840SBT1_9BURK|nr:acyltransferase family protein [Inhella inkyongensis]MBB5206224.1 peptidoglycan/LPS O-acetylase OafA/YrhL [Inhella inkyongensis]